MHTQNTLQAAQLKQIRQNGKDTTCGQLYEKQVWSLNTVKVAGQFWDI